jgi:Holliday junction resolvasome RuvABC endonuclease subunit
MKLAKVLSATKPPLVLGVDPGLAHMGLALVRIEPDHEIVEGLHVIETKKSDDKKVTVGRDNVRRAQELGAQLVSIADRFDILLIAAEAMSFPENASNAGKMSIAWGVLSLFALINGIPIEQASPQRIKRACCGDHKASKDDVEFALLRRYGNHVEDLLLGPNRLREHAFDSLGAVVSLLDCEVIRLARSTRVA